MIRDNLVDYADS